jgi:hypothetical protein
MSSADELAFALRVQKEEKERNELGGAIGVLPECRERAPEVLQYQTGC